MTEEEENQKGDKGIEKIEKEEWALARILDIWDAFWRQRTRKGRWR